MTAADLWTRAAVRNIGFATRQADAYEAYRKDRRARRRWARAVPVLVAAAVIFALIGAAA